MAKNQNDSNATLSNATLRATVAAILEQDDHLGQDSPAEYLDPVGTGTINPDDQSRAVEILRAASHLPSRVQKMLAKKARIFEVSGFRGAVDRRIASLRFAPIAPAAVETGTRAESLADRMA